MKRTEKAFKISYDEEFKYNILSWAQQFEEFVWLDSNDYSHQYSNFEAILAADALTSLKTDFIQAFENLKEYQSFTNDWLFGYLTYDLKNDIEDLSSNNTDGIKFPDLFFFQPKKLIKIKNNEIIFDYLKMVDDEIEEDFRDICNAGHPAIINESCTVNTLETGIKLRINKDQYYSKVNKILEHIHRGDIYEANFCQEFYALNTEINPLQTYHKLNSISKPPFATFLKMGDKFLLSASPERYLKKEGEKIISQPIKGTAKRANTAFEDDLFRFSLENDPKERSENIMIVDLVRNDLSRIAKKGSVKVKELCQVYTFEQVHQMISTVEAEVKDHIHPVDVIKATFPMGSMTGAPKISAMKVIEAMEETKRGLYSGAAGYFKPSGDFDFNVIIRSILYNKTEKYVSYSVGSAITSKSIPEKEYEECLIKAKAMKQVLEGF